ARAGLALLAGFVGWSYLSMLWAVSPGSAWEASNELLLYLVSAWVLALVPWTGRSAGIFVGAWSVGIVLVCAITLVEGVVTSHVSGFLYAFRFQSPIGYPNADAALGAMAFLPALGLSNQRRAPAPVQGLLLTSAAFLLEFSFLAQSRAAAAAAILSLAFLLALASDRWRLLLRIAVVSAAFAASISTVLDVYSTAEAGHAVGPAIDRAALWIMVTSVLAGVLGASLARLEGALALGSERQRSARRAAGALAAVTIVLLAALFGSRFVGAVGDELDAIGSGKEASTNRFAKTTLYERPDYWRVSLDMFDEHPLAGAGAGAFEQEYTVRRKEPKYSRYAHNIWLRALGEEGVVGAALLIGFAVLVLGYPVKRLRALGGRRAVISGSLATVFYFFLHASFDWLDEIPALAAPAFGLGLIALALTAPAGTSARIRRRGAARGGVLLGQAALLGVALLALVPPYLSHRYLESALSSWSGDPHGAYEDIHRAAALNPLSGSPRVAEGRIAVALRQPRRARRAFGDALAIEDFWYPHLQLALLDAREGSFRIAERQITEARRLSRKDPFISSAATLIRERRRVDPKSFNAAMESQIQRSFTSGRK
ncbi:MAG TPA: O-antigen ligase family protein, partial [Chloroflexota bacterium]|nr:O-antigen ligase family protein [Chloroflexota bacterium]